MAEESKNNEELTQLVSDYRTLFWYTPEKSLASISPGQIVETILNYGDEIAVKRLFQALGVDTVAKIFQEQTTRSQRSKNNYHELVANFFQLYFSRHAKEYSFK